MKEYEDNKREVALYLWMMYFFYIGFNGFKFDSLLLMPVEMGRESSRGKFLC
jgi:hypothetical protein